MTSFLEVKMLKYFKELAKEYNMSLENVLSIALNRYGIIVDNFTDSRIRFNLQMLYSEKNTFFAVCVNTYPNSPFKLQDGVLYLENDLVGKVNNIEEDTCTSTYFRNNKKAITFNSNSRSKCAGCKFCGTYSLTDDDHIDFSTKENIQKYFENLLATNKIKSMHDIEDVTICTGCFNSEDDLVKHLLLVNNSFKEMSFDGRINYIGSQLRDYQKIKMIKDELGSFGLYLTIEKFLDREKFMRPEKASLTLDKAKELLEYSSSIGITSTFLYILGLESLEAVEHNFNYFKNSINKFPIIQVFQDYTPQQEQYRAKEAKDVRYYLEAKKIINNIFKEKKLHPELWECFRSLYFDDKKEGIVKCKKK